VQHRDLVHVGEARAMGPIAHHLDGLVGTKITLKP
jgi:hypothetical protein